MAMFRSSPRDVESRPPNKKRCNKTKKDGTYFCNICLDGWDSETEVEIHRSSAHKMELLSLIKNSTARNVCRICVKPHMTRQDLIKHIKIWHLLSSEDAMRVEREIFICDTCSSIFFNKLLMEVHIINFHMGVDKSNTFAACPKCYKMQRIKTMWYHFQAHHIQSVACCKICLMKCKNRDEVREHIKSHKKYLFCDICQYESKTEAYFKEHLNTRHNITDHIDITKDKTIWNQYFVPNNVEFKANVILDIPSKGLPLSYLDEHSIRICILCREICIGHQSMVDHMQNHNVIKPHKPLIGHICSCGETFSSMVLLKHHMLKAKEGHCKVELVNEDDSLVIVSYEGAGTV